MIDVGLRAGGGIGDSMSILQYDHPNYLSKFAFTVSFYILVNVIALNIVFGIIIDTFAELRDKQS
jgi:hypothetical protein